MTMVSLFLLGSFAFGQEPRVWDGHLDAVYALQTSRDGKTILSADVAGTVMGWDWETNKLLQKFPLADRGLLTLAVSPDNRQFAAGSVDGKIFLADVPMRTFLGQMGNPAPGVVSGFVVTPDGRFLLEGDQGNYVRMWDTATGAHVRDFGGSVGGIFAIGLDPQKPNVLAASMDGMIRGWQIDNAQPVPGIQTSPLRGMVVVPGETTRLVTLGDDGSLKLMRWPAVLPQTLQGHSNQVTAVATSPDGKWILTGSLDQQLILSKSSDGAFVRTFPGPIGPLTAVAVNADSTIAAAASQTGIIKFWKLDDGAELGQLTGHVNAIFDLTFHGARNELVTAGHDATVRVWSVPAPATPWLGAAGTIAEIVASSKSDFVVSVGADKAIRLWNPTNGALTKTLDGFEQPLTAVAVSADDQWIAAGDATGQIHLRKPDGTSGGVQKVYDGAIGRIVWKPDGKQLTVCGSDGKVKLLAVPFTAAAEPLKVIDADTVKIYDLAQSADGSQLFTAGEDKLVKLWSADGVLVRQFGPYPSVVRHLALSADGTAIAAVGDPSGGQTHAVIWNVADGAAIRDLDTAIGITGGCFLPDGTFVVYGADRKARRYELKTPLLLEMVEFPTPNTAAFSLADGKTLIGGGADNKLYRLGYNLQQFLLGHTGPVRAAIFDGDDMISAGDDSTMRRWKLADKSVTQTFTGHTAAVHDLALSADHLASVSADTNLRIFPRAKTPEQLAVKDVAATMTFKHPGILRAVAAQGTTFVTTSDDSLIRRWEPTLGELERLSGQAGQILSVAALADGRLISGATDNTARLWVPSVTQFAAIGSAQGLKLAGSADGTSFAVVGRGPAGMPDRLSAWKLGDTLERTAGPVDLPAVSDVVAIQADARLIALGSALGFSLWNLADLKPITEVVHPAPVTGLAFSQQGKRLAVAVGPTLVHYDVTRKDNAVEVTLVHDTIAHPNNIVAMAVGPDDRTIFTAAQDNIVRKYQSASSSPRTILAAGKAPVYTTAYSADGRWLVSAGADGQIRLWNVAAGKLVDQAETPQAVNSAAFSVAGDLLVTGGDDGLVRVWKVATPMIDPNTPVAPENLMAKLEPLQTWTCADGKTSLPVRSVIFSTDLNWVIAGTARGTMFAWKTNEPLVEPMKLETHNAPVTTLRYNLANNRLASFDTAGHVAMWNPGNWAFLAFQRLPVGVSGTNGAYGLDGISWITGQRSGKILVTPITVPGR